MDLPYHWHNARKFLKEIAGSSCLIARNSRLEVRQLSTANRWQYDATVSTSIHRFAALKRAFSYKFLCQLLHNHTAHLRITFPVCNMLRQTQNIKRSFCNKSKLCWREWPVLVNLLQRLLLHPNTSKIYLLFNYSPNITCNRIRLNLFF